MQRASVLAAEGTETMEKWKWCRLWGPALSWYTCTPLLQISLSDTGGAVKQLHVAGLEAHVGRRVSEPSGELLGGKNNNVFYSTFVRNLLFHPLCLALERAP